MTQTPSTREFFLSLGSNIEPRLAAIDAAVECLRALRIRALKISPVFETAAKYLTDQPKFLNCVVSFESELQPHVLLQEIQAIELSLGRKREVRFGPRTIDLDILSAGNFIHADDDLVLPHPRLEERAFVLIPLLEIAPSWAHPENGATASEMLARLHASELEEVRFFGEISAESVLPSEVDLLEIPEINAS